MSARDRLTERRTIAAHLAETIRERIITQVYAPGLALREAELARQFKVSRIPLREALRQIEAEGFVTIQPYRGAIVTTMSEEDCIEVAEIRSVLLQLAVRWKLPRLSDADLQHLDDVVTKMQGEADPHRWGALVAEFHEILFDLSERPRLKAMLEALQLQSRRYMTYLHRKENLRQLAEHGLRGLADACQGHDPDLAARRVAAYFDTLISSYLAQSDTHRPGRDAVV